MDRIGTCLCGGVQFIAKNTSAEVSVCHCDMCRRWAGGSWFSLFAEDVEWTSRETLGVIQSSEWAERGFCTKCGSCVFYRSSAPDKHQGIASVSLGCLDDLEGLTLTREWFIDKKPELYCFTGERQTVTEEQAFAMFAGGDGE